MDTRFFWVFLLLAFTGALFMYIPGGLALQKLLICALAGFCILKRNGKLYVPSWLRPYLYILVALVCFSFLSAYNYFGSVAAAILVSQKYILLLVSFFIAGYFAQDVLLTGNLRKIRKAVLFLTISQLCFVLLKFSILGRIDEGFLIGSMHHNAGQLGFLFPALMLPVVVFLFGSGKITPTTILLLTALFLFSLLNEKRAIFYLGGPILIFSFVVCQQRLLSVALVTRLASMIILVTLLISVFAPQIDSLSGREANGRIDGKGLVYLANYAREYLTMDYGGPLQAEEAMAAQDTRVQVGRFIVIARGFDFMLESQPSNLWIGHGLGFITASKYLNAPDIMFKELGFRGAINGAILMFIEGGIVGVSLMSMLLFGPLIRLIWAWRNAKHFGELAVECRKWTAICLSLLGICMFDFFLYSNILFTTLPMPLLFFFILFAIPDRSWLVKFNTHRMNGRHSE